MAMEKEETYDYYKLRDGVVLKAVKHFVGRNKNMFETANNNGCIFYHVCEPATIEEYNYYRSKNKKP
jgi:hypothetical protein